MNWDKIQDYISIRYDGTLVWQSLLSKMMTPKELERLFDLCGKYTVYDGEEEYIQWEKVKEEMEGKNAKWG